jgi:aspartate/tyrosine/aromatic aminotransferase
MGGLRLGFDLIKHYFPESSIYTPNPTYPPHLSMAKLVGIKNLEYRYYDKENASVNFKGMCEDF